MEARRPRRVGVRSTTAVAHREFCGVDEIALGEMPGTKLGGDRMRRLRVQGAWAVAVGWQIRKVTRPCSLRSDTLTVEVRDRAWLAELEKLAPRITARLKALIPGDPVRKVVFRIGPVAQPQVSTRPDDRLPEHAKGARPGTGSGMSASLAKVGDEALRDRLESIIDRYLLHKRAAG